VNSLRRADLLVTGVALFGGCAALTDVPDPAPPPDAVQIRVYTNGGEGGPGVPESVWWTFRSVESDAQRGVVTQIPEATCVAIGKVWFLSIEVDGVAIPIDRFRHDQFSGATPLGLMIDRDPTGRVTVSEGLPGWMIGKPIGCAPL
jgi:hypothetical protein